MKRIPIKDYYWHRIVIDNLKNITPADQNYYLENQYEEFVTIDVIGNCIFIWGKDSILNRLYITRVAVDISEKLRNDKLTYSFWSCYALVDTYGKSWELDKFIKEAKNMDVIDIMPSSTMNGISAAGALPLLESLESLELIFSPDTTLKEMMDAVSDVWSATMVCPSCKGRGRYTKDTFCHRCSGSGYIFEDEDF